VKSPKLTCLIALTSLALLPIQSQVLAQEQEKRQQIRYRLIDMGTFGGPASYVNIPDAYAQVLNDRGIVTGSADTSTPDPYQSFCFNEDCFVSHAFESHAGILRDLGVLPGGASSGANWISKNGLIVGESQNGTIDPLIPGFPELHAVLWNKGTIVDIGTVEGGNESIANSVNTRGQIVGWSLNGIPDDSSITGLGYQTRAFVWQKGVMQDLGTLGGPDAMANLVNESGQIVGESYTSSTPSPYCAENLGLSLTTGAFLWQDGKMFNLGGFGGTCTFASDLNSRGQVVGTSTLTGDLAQHPFLWDRTAFTDLGTFGGTQGSANAINDAGEAVGWAAYPGDLVLHASRRKNGRMTDLGTINGDPLSFAFTINGKGEVAGSSVNSDFSQFRAFLWHDGGPMVDLNTLIPGDSALYLTVPETINERGEIAGIGLDPNGNQHAFLLVPCQGSDTNCSDAALQVSGNPVSPFPSVYPSSRRPQGIFRLRRGFGPFLRAPQIVPLGKTAGDTLGRDGTANMSSSETGSSTPQSNTLTNAQANGLEPAPTNLHCTVRIRSGFDVVTLYWTDNSSDEDSYRVERCIGSGCTNFSQIAATAPNTVTYADGFGAAHLTVRYRVRAHGPTGYSSYSNTLTVTF
jgi:probable HAF family extracellular repeat protein